MPCETKTTIDTYNSLVVPVLGAVDLDPAGCGDSVVIAKTTWTGDTVDGLVPAWASIAKTVWLLPPKKSEEKHKHTLNDWVEKAYRESRAGASVLSILPAKTGVGWFHHFVTRSAGFTLLQQKYEVQGDRVGDQLSVLWSSDLDVITRYQHVSEKRGLLVVNA